MPAPPIFCCLSHTRVVMSSAATRKSAPSALQSLPANETILKPTCERRACRILVHHCAGSFSSELSLRKEAVTKEIEIRG